MGGSQGLESSQRIPYQEEVGLLIVIHVVGQVTYYKIPYTSFIEFTYVVMTVVTFGLQCKEKGLGGETERPAVC